MTSCWLVRFCACPLVYLSLVGLFPCLSLCGLLYGLSVACLTCFLVCLSHIGLIFLFILSLIGLLFSSPLGRRPVSYWPVFLSLSLTSLPVLFPSCRLLACCFVVFLSCLNPFSCLSVAYWRVFSLTCFHLCFVCSRACSLDLLVLPLQPELVYLHRWRGHPRGAVDNEAPRQGNYCARAGGDALHGETSERAFVPSHLYGGASASQLIQ